MSLVQEAEALRHRQGGVCGVYLLEQTLEPAERDELSEALASPVQSAALARALSKRGHEVKSNALQRHRRRDCVCAR